MSSWMPARNDRDDDVREAGSLPFGLRAIRLAYIVEVPFLNVDEIQAEVPALREPSQ